MVRKVPVLARVMRAEEVERDRSAPKRSKFAAKPTAIWELLQRELRMLRATDAVCELDAHERYIQKRSGEWYGDTKPRRSLVIFTINRPPRRGVEQPPLVFRGGQYNDWQDNVYAIARTLEALRMVERYGCTAGGEQYTGFAALPPPKEQPDTLDRDAAAALIAEVSGDLQVRPGRVHKASIAGAIQKAHPDHGGTAELLRRVLAARRTLEEAGAVYG